VERDEGELTEKEREDGECRQTDHDQASANGRDRGKDKLQKQLQTANLPQ